MSLRQHLIKLGAVVLVVLRHPIGVLKYLLTCHTCQGTGVVARKYPEDLIVFDELEMHTCGQCKGTGWLHSVLIRRYLKCDVCDGSGTITDTYTPGCPEVTCSGCHGSGWRWSYLRTHYQRRYRELRDENYYYTEDPPQQFDP